MALIERTFSDRAKAVNTNLAQLVTERFDGSLLREPISYTLLSAGKRLRPLLVLETAALLGLEEKAVMRTACAIEFVHTSSLVFDDLPCMDDSKTRRGQPCLHLAYDESTAILAALSLLVEAFPLVAADCRTGGLSLDETDQALLCLSQTVGGQGMALGQYLDLKRVPGMPKPQIGGLKTATLMMACVELAGRLGHATAEYLAGLRSYGERLGQAYQLHDDHQDISQDRENAGSIAQANDDVLRHRVVSDAVTPPDFPSHSIELHPGTVGEGK